MQKQTKRQEQLQGLTKLPQLSLPSLLLLPSFLGVRGRLAVPPHPQQGTVESSTLAPRPQQSPEQKAKDNFSFRKERKNGAEGEVDGEREGRKK